MGDKTLDMLMKISIEGPKTLEDEKLERIIDMEAKIQKTSCLNIIIIEKAWGEAYSAPAPPD